MKKKNNVLFCVEFCGNEHPNVYWGIRVPSIGEARKFLRDIGHQNFLEEFDDDITDVFEITDYKQAEGLWNLEIEFPHFNG